jgi:sugar phosphate permease
MPEPHGDLRRTRQVRWLILLVPGAIYFFSYFHRIAPAVVAEDLMRAFAIPAATLGNLAAIYPYVFAVMALPAGSLSDTLGPRWTLAMGAATMGLGSALFGLAPLFGVAAAGRLLVGLGASVILIAFLRLAAEWFRPNEFATISGWSQTAGSLGAIVATSPLAILVEGFGWRASFVMIGGITLLLGVGAALFVSDRPEDMGLPPVNAARSGRALSFREVFAGIPSIAANPRTWPPVLASAGAYGTLVTFVGLWGVPYLTQTYGLTRVEASNLMVLAATGIMVGSPLIGWISDRGLSRRRLPMVVGFLLYVFAWILMVAPGQGRIPVGWLGPICFLMGFASGAIIIALACVREVNNPERVGLSIGFHNLPVFLGIALLQWITGVILDSRWEGIVAGGRRVYPFAAYHAVFTFCLGVTLIALLLACLVTETRCQNVWRRVTHDPPAGSPKGAA